MNTLIRCKKWIRTGIAAVLLLSMAVLPINAAASESWKTASAASVYEEVEKQAQTAAKMLTALYGATSVQYALMDQGEIVVSGQAGVYSKKDKNLPDSGNMYGIGSVSKVFTAAAVMQLVDSGKVKLDKPVMQYLPEFKMADKRYKEITVRMLLNHSSGLLGSTFSNAMLLGDNDTLSMDTLLENLKSQRLKADPGAFSVYCNDGFSLAELLVERVSGLSFSGYLKQYVSAPLQLENTKTPQDSFDRAQLAKTYKAGIEIELPADTVNAIGAGGIYSTAEDLCRFAQIFQYNEENEVLTRTSAKAMAKSEYKSGLWYPGSSSQVYYGLGWDSVDTYPFQEYGIKALVKGGDTLLYHASLIVLPEEGMTMAVLLSGAASTYGRTFAQNVLLKALLAKGRISEIKPDKAFTAPVKTAMPKSEKSYEGLYGFSGGVAKIEISESGNLNLYNGNTPVQKFVYTGDGKFYASDGSAYLSFCKESNGNTYLYLENYVGLPGLGQVGDSNYQAQKIEANPLSEKVKSAWDKRAGKRYFLMNEKYSSQIYALSYPAIKITLSEFTEGYCFGARIINENQAQTQVQIPGMAGRDLMDLQFTAKSKTEYLSIAGGLYIGEDAVKAISSKDSFQITIGADGYACWYKIGSAAGGRKLKVTVPKNASFSVYDSKDICTYSSLITKENTVTLPKGGYIVFAGNQGAKFKVKYVE
ncbi:CubicO group peptidase (beta-lactamase class C family) [Anaerotaenia torta]|uniref:serine hydrolase domain-containing protein n=1 Tax=Anaerotaenia torta TaxID=433293 RepID=UPI003D24296E